MSTGNAETYWAQGYTYPDSVSFVLKPKRRNLIQSYSSPWTSKWRSNTRPLESGCIDFKTVGFLRRPHGESPNVPSTVSYFVFIFQDFSLIAPAFLTYAKYKLLAVLQSNGCITFSVLSDSNACYVLILAVFRGSRKRVSAIFLRDARRVINELYQALAKKSGGCNCYS